MSAKWINTARHLQCEKNTQYPHYLRGVKKVKITATENFSTSDKGWRGVKKHMEHDPKLNHSNKDIFAEVTKYNQSGEVFSQTVIRKRLDAFFGKYVKEHDQKAIKSRHKDRIWGSVEKYLSSKKKVTVVATIGDMETKNTLIKQLCPQGSYKTVPIPSSPTGQTLVITDPEVAEKFYGTYAEALRNFLSCNYKINGASNFSYLIPGRYSIHVDEAGAPHVHFEVFPTGRTNKGRPTCSLNQTISSFAQRALGKKISGRKALAWYRDFFDKAMVNQLNHSFTKAYPDKFQGLEFYRKGSKDVGRSMEQIKHLKAQEQAAKKPIAHTLVETAQSLHQISGLQISVDNNINAISHPDDAFIALMQRSLANLLSTLKKMLKHFIIAMKKKEQDLTKRSESLSKREQALNDKYSEFDRKVAEISSRERSLQQQEQQLGPAFHFLGDVLRQHPAFNQSKKYQQAVRALYQGKLPTNIDVEQELSSTLYARTTAIQHQSLQRNRMLKQKHGIRR